MLKKTVTYTDYDGNERTEEFFFNLNKAEVTEMELSTEGGMEKMLKKIIESRDGKRIIEVMKDIVLRAYGEKSPDGRRFIKTPEMREAFSQTKAASDFVRGILPPVPADTAASLPAETPAG